MFIHPLMRLAMQQPHLIATHLSAYVKLAGDEASKTSSSLAMRAGLYVGAGVMALIGLILLGVALLFVAATPSEDWTVWALITVPVAPFVASAVMVLVARGKPVDQAFAILKQQVDADLTLIREASAP